MAKKNQEKYRILSEIVVKKSKFPKKNLIQKCPTCYKMNQLYKMPKLLLNYYIGTFKINEVFFSSRILDYQGTYVQKTRGLRNSALIERFLSYWNNC